MRCFTIFLCTYLFNKNISEYAQILVTSCSFMIFTLIIYYLLQKVLKNGVVLCKLMNKISPGSVTKFKQAGPAFLLMENVQTFLKAVKSYGVPDEEVFQTPDLFEARNIPQVTLCIYALARTTQKHPEYSGPSMGPKMATKNERNFSDEQIRQGMLNELEFFFRAMISQNI